MGRKLPAPRGSVEIARRNLDVVVYDAGELESGSMCPGCGRVTRTLPHGACAECWQPKTPDARPVLRSKPPATTSLLDLGAIPDWVWVAAAVAFASALVRVIVGLG